MLAKKVLISFFGTKLCMKYYLISGENSGDKHGAGLMRALAQIDPEAKFRGLGGQHMRAAGLDSFYKSDRIGIQGNLTKVFLSIRKFLQLRAHTKADILSYAPHIVVCIDFSDFNLPLATFTHRKGIYTTYYIPPKAWLWRSYRARIIKRSLDCVLCIFPWEPSFYEKYSYEAAFYVGNPSVKDVEHYRHKRSEKKTPFVALLPGSRLNEIKSILPIYTAVCKQRPDLRFKVSVMSHLPDAMYQAIERLPNVERVEDNTRALLSQADVALVALGTANLEAALIGTPQLICYKFDVLARIVISFFPSLSRRFKSRMISLVNIILGRRLVTELLNRDFNPRRISQLLDQLLRDQALCERIQAGYAEIREQLGHKDAPTEAATRLMQSYEAGAVSQSNQ